MCVCSCERAIEHQCQRWRARERGGGVGMAGGGREKDVQRAREAQIDLKPEA
jgi:hypothetical protein